MVALNWYYQVSSTLTSCCSLLLKTILFPSLSIRHEVDSNTHLRPFWADLENLEPRFSLTSVWIQKLRNWQFTFSFQKVQILSHFENYFPQPANIHMKPLQPTKRPELKAQESLQQLIGIIDDVKVFLIPSVLFIAITYSFSIRTRCPWRWSCFNIKMIVVRMMKIWCQETPWS